MKLAKQRTQEVRGVYLITEVQTEDGHVGTGQLAARLAEKEGFIFQKNV